MRSHDAPPRPRCVTEGVDARSIVPGECSGHIQLARHAGVAVVFRNGALGRYE